MANAQQEYPKVIGYENGQHVATPGNGNLSAISFSGGSPFATKWKSVAIDGSKYMLQGMRHDILFLENAFNADLFASKGYYGDFVELKWDLVRYTEQVTGFRIYRKVLGSTADSIQVANVPSDSRNWRDEYAESGVMYEYFLFAEGIFPSYRKFMNYISGVGFRVPYGRISGRVTYEGGSAVQGVSIIAETEDDFRGSSIKLNGTDAYLAISPTLDNPLFELDTAMTFQAWFRPETPTVTTRTLFEKSGQYKLTHSKDSLTFWAGTQSLGMKFPEKTDTFFHVTAMRTSDSLKIIIVYDEETSYISKSKITAAVVTTANNNAVNIGKGTTGSLFKGWVDEVKIWHKSFSEEDIIRHAGMFFAGTEDNLSAYYRMNEGVGNNFFDLSRKGFTFNANDGYKHSTAQWSSDVPFSQQLAVKGITDSNGNYMISGIPYATDGSIYRFVPVYGVHSFDPTERLIFIGEGATAHSNIDFIDVASFPVKGAVYYNYTDFPVEGVSIKVDGRVAVTSEGTPIVTDQFGKFNVDVPIGQHYIQLVKHGHTFENNGRFPATEGQNFDFQEAYTFQTRFKDETLIKVIGRVVGGPVQAAKPKGLGKTVNNIGVATITFGTEKGYDLIDSNPGPAIPWVNYMYRNGVPTGVGNTITRISPGALAQIDIIPDPITGEFITYLLPEKYKITGITAGTYTYPSSFHTTVDLTSNLLLTEIDSVKLYPPVISGIDTVYNYRIDSVQYQKNLELIYRENPTLNVTAKDGNRVFWESNVIAKDSTDVNVIHTPSGNPLTDWPIFIQRDEYHLKISVFERYINGAVIDDVPVTDGNVEVVNALAIDKSRKLFQVSKLGIVDYTFKGGLPNTVGDYTNSMSIIAYTGNGGSIQTPWKYKQEAPCPNPYEGNLKGYIIGGLPTGNNFVTTGPASIDMIIRDPGGSNSYSYFEQSQTFTTSSTTTFSDEFNENISSDFMLGGEVTTFAGVGAGVIINTSTHNTTTVGLEMKQTWVDESTSTSTVTSLKRWQTSDDEEFIGAIGDVFIGHSTNIVYGKCIFVKLLLPSEGSDHVGAGLTPSNFKIGKYTGMRYNPQFETAFQYSQNHIKNYLIPNLKELRNTFIVNHSGAPFNYRSTLPLDDEDYGSNNVPREKSSTTNSPTNSSYRYTIPATWPDNVLFTDTVRFFNKQIKGWEDVLEMNEKEKIEATLKENLSFDAGAIYEGSETHSNTTSRTETFEFQVLESLASQTGGDVGGLGVTVNVEMGINSVSTNAEGTETTDEITYGYVLNDSDEGDYFSIDVKEPSTHFGPIFATRGGQSQCPHEHAEVTEYYLPGTTISEAVMQREVPRIACNIPVQVNVPEDQKALFEVELRNASETDDDAWFMVSIDHLSNQDGAKISIDGHSIANGRVIFIPASTVMNKLITIEKIDPAVNDYTDIGIIFHSICQFDPGNNWPDIADTLKLTARFKPVCSGVQLTSPIDLWVTNTNTNPIDILPIVIDDYNLAHTGFEKILFQYKPTSTSQWTTDMIYYMDPAQFAAAPEPKTLINGDPILNYNWDMSSQQDRNYHVRAFTTCANGTTNESVILGGIKDTKRPKIFGTPQPGDGILSPGDDVMLTFDESIMAGLLLDDVNFSVRGVLNGANIRHNSALYFDGIDDYAKVISGVNLQDKSFTIEFWTKRGDLTPGVIFQQADIELGFDASHQFYTKLGTQTQATSTTYNFTDKWIHLAVSFDYQTKKLEITSTFDGHLLTIPEVTGINFPSTFNGQGQMKIGVDRNGILYYNGYLHDLRIWESVKGYGSIKSNKLLSMNGDEIGLGGMWPMDEAHGDYAEDLSRSHNAMLRGPSWKVFPTGNARAFDGTASRVDIQTATSILITEEMDFTLEFWFKADDTPANANTVMFSNGKTDGTEGAAATPDIWEIGMNATQNIYVKNNGTSITSLSSNHLDNEWHHLAVVLNRNGNTTLYIDGKMENYAHSSNFGGIKGAEMTLGASRNDATGTPYSNYFDGSIDEFRFWKLARTSKLLNMDMNAKLSGDEKGLVAYYPFDKYDINLILQPSLADCDLVEVITDGHINMELSGNVAIATNGSFNNTDVPNLKDARPVQKLAFNHVVNDNKIIINIDEPADLVEKCVIEFTVDKVQDLRENRMASPVTWTAYIKKNTVIWDDYQLNFEKELYDPLSFNVDILNIGGNEQNYTIDNLPAWLSISEETGNLLPDSRKTITFVVAESVNIGNYDVSLFLSSDFGYSEKLELNLKVFKTPPTWEVDPEDYQYSMSVIGQVKIDDIFSSNTDDIVAAFVGDECRGVANLQYMPDYDMFEVFLNIYSDTISGDEVTFKIWNASEGIEHSNVTPELIFALNTVIGTPAIPQILETTNSYDREIVLPQGWKWLSFNVNDPNLSNVNTLLKDISAQNNDMVKGQSNFTIFGDSLNTWTGLLVNSGGFKKEKMYMAKMSQEDTLHISGGKFHPLSSPIALNPGWNWIGYTPQVNIPINDALGNINPTSGDLIKSQYAFSIYDPAMGWLGSLEYMLPSQGYMYQNLSADTLTLVYPIEGLSRSGDIVTEGSENLRVPQWHINKESFQYTSSVLGELIYDSEVTQNCIIGAFVGDECRGIVRPVSIGGAKRYFLTIYSNTPEEEISFKLLDKNTNQFFDIYETILFIPNALNGNLELPQRLTVNSATSVSSFSGNNISIYPNPTNGKVTVDLNSNSKLNKVNYEITDISGKVLANEILLNNKQVIDFETLGAGVYFLKINSGTGIFIEKIVVQ